MKKSRLFLATGALVLAASALFATKANKKFAGAVITGYSHTSGDLAIKTTGGTGWLTVSNTNNPAIVTLTTQGGTVLLRTQLVTSTGLNKHKLYY
jgi:hypothetical protein